ncbi:MAG: PH domain-containing protein [Spirochaetales bacterium]|uniref:PH domain-containing protein n=1 Tax=Candidatus Thalassospirochaeta sargassi TaxID=3119039 RepID=A0AAJ1IE19_9SPIO|nr:PH domain-containing protein [Spirochaetales bacterium]
MIITLSMGTNLLIAFGIIMAIVLVLMILRPGQTNQKLLSIGILLVTFTVIYFILGRPANVVIDEKGIHTESYGKIDFEWSEVESAAIVEDYRNSKWNPEVKITGSGMPGFKTGRYRLDNGETAKIITQKSNKAVVFQTDDAIYLFAFDEIEKIIETASEYVAF